MLNRNDPVLKCFDPMPALNDENALVPWKKSNKKSKATIILCFRDSALAKTHNVVDDESKSAKDLLDDLAPLYTTSSTQAVSNLLDKLDNLLYKEEDSRDTLVSMFLSVVDELAAHEGEMVTKLVRSFPMAFDPLAQSITPHKQGRICD